MNRSIVVPLIAVLVAACAPVQAPRRVTPRFDAIYRSINPARGGTIRLGRRFVADSLAQPVSDSVFQLRPGAVLDPDLVHVLVTSTRDVYAMTFEYVAGETYEQQVGAYAKLLGPPTRSLQQADGAAVTRWEDDATRFDILGRPGRRVMSRLTDRRLGRV